MMNAFRPTRALVDLSALAANLKIIRSRLGEGTRILAVVKANAYGHGAVVCARHLVREGVDGLGVATVEEGIELREAGLKCFILLLGGVPKGGEEAVLSYNLTPAVFDLDQAIKLESAAKKGHRTVGIHLKIDTGMTRLGISPEEVEDVVSRLLGLGSVTVEGIFSHLAQADLARDELTERQARLFEIAVNRCGKALGTRSRNLLTHLANSAASVTRGSMGYSMVRPGLMLYGAYPSARFRDIVTLQPVLRLESEIIAIKNVSSGVGVSYGWTFVTRRPSRIATVPIGYADGYPRLLSNRSQVLVRGRRVPVVGAVCMDHLMIDVTDGPGAAVGDTVTLIGRDGGESIDALELAGEAGLIPYEVLCGISARVPRIYEGSP